MKTTTKKKIGRPKIENPKEQVQCFRLTDDEATLLDWMAKSSGRNQGQLCRELVATGIVTYYVILKKANKEKEPFALLLRQLLKKWAVDPTATIPKSMVSEFMNSDEIPKEWKKDYLDFFD